MAYDHHYPSSLPSPSSSSSSNPRRRCLYDVFLSFRGKDTRKNFAGHLYAALIQAGIQTFSFRDDDDDMNDVICNEISSESLKAIRSSKVAIVVFSKNYASSSWCLDELADIMDCCEDGKLLLVIPLFYDVDPIHVCHQTGAFGVGFAKLIGEVDQPDKVGRWRAALAQAGNLSGWDLQDAAHRYEAKFIKKIVGHVADKVKREKLYVSKHPVGLDSRIEELNLLLRIGSNDVRVVGIYGMPGVGKTTTAKALYNSVYHLFEGCCFLANIQEVSEEPNGLAYLQEQILAQILMAKKVNVSNDHIGTTLIKERLCHKRVLIVLDDIGELSQLERLAGQRHWFGLGTRIIITTKNEFLLTQAKVDERYEVKEMNYEDSLSLFSWHAFQKPVPSKSYEELSRKIVNYAGGLPLALEVLGSSLRGRSINEWECNMKKLQKILPNQIQKKLRISFDLLDDDKVKDIFLDIACFFIGMNKEYVIDILDGCGFFPGVGITILLERSLLKIEWDRIRMHDIVRDMGREVVREMFPYEPWNRSRLWCNGDAYDVLSMCKGTEAIEGVALDLQTETHLGSKSFAMMQKLRLLKINNVQLHGSFKGLFEELRWLCWHHCPLEFLPSDLHLEKLVALDMQYSNIRLWQGTKFLNNLKYLNLSNSKFLKRTPDFTGVPRLDKLSLRFCSSLLEIDPSIGSLDRLIELNLGYCENLKSLPSSICKLMSLEDLHLDECSSLQQLPMQLGNLESLRSLHITGAAIKELPISVGHLKKLKTLNLAETNRRRKIEARRWFSFLQFGTLSQSVSEMTFLPPTVSSLVSIRHLDLRENHLDDGDVPEDLSALTSLRMLYLNGNNFQILPSSLGQLSSLEILWLYDCKSLQVVLKLPPNLRVLDASNCTSLKKLPNLSNLKHLKCLELNNCSRLAEIEGLEKLDCILDIYLEGCSNLAPTFEKKMFQVYSERVVTCSIYLSRREIPHWFKYQQMGSSISFDVPLNIENDLSEMTIWVDYVNHDRYGVGLSATIKNVTKDIEWHHQASFLRTFEVNSWVCHGPIPCTIKGGDRIDVSIGGDEGLKVEKCGIHLVYKSDIKVPEDISDVTIETDVNEFENDINLKRSHNLVGISCDSFAETEFSKRLKVD